MRYLKGIDGSKGVAGRWEHSHDHLLSTEEGVADEFAGAQRDGLLSIGHVCWLYCSVSANLAYLGYACSD